MDVLHWLLAGFFGTFLLKFSWCLWRPNSLGDWFPRTRDMILLFRYAYFSPEPASVDVPETPVPLGSYSFGDPVPIIATSAVVPAPVPALVRSLIDEDEDEEDEDDWEDEEDEEDEDDYYDDEDDDDGDDYDSDDWDEYPDDDDDEDDWDDEDEDEDW